MTLKYISFRGTFLFATASILLSVSCTNPGKKDGEDLPPVDSDQNGLVNVEGKVFSIPSPIQTAFLIKSSGSSYNKDLLNAPNKITQYSTNFSKALNVGVYGADLGYVTMYDQTQDAISYLNSVRKLSDEIGISGAFDAQTITRFTKNLGNKDSMLSLVGVAYRASDVYLKNSQMKDLSALILAGGWVESLYFTTNVYKAKANEDVKMRIGEQKTSLHNLIELLNKFYNTPDYTEFIDSLKDLQTVYDGVEFKYTFVEPTTDVDKKTTTINSKTEVKISAEQLESITKKIKVIRDGMVG